MKKFRVIFTFETINNLEAKDIPELIKEQWEQTASSMEGDKISMIDVRECE